MKPEVRDVINNINRFIQEQKYINVSSNLKMEENVVARNLNGKDPEVVAEVMENLELIFKEISEVHNAGQADEYTERYYYLSDKFYTDMKQFKIDFFSDTIYDAVGIKNVQLKDGTMTLLPKENANSEQIDRINKVNEEIIKLSSK